MATKPKPDFENLLQAAVEVRKRAYSPYSRFAVGAAVETDGGHVFTGCNVENAAFGTSMCAERVALFSAIAAGHRSLLRLALVADLREPLSPCGPCRQVIAELAPDMTILMANMRGDIKLVSIRDLLPFAFTLKRRPDA
jgi:cytidine deaminase